jgi:hypothetical protein
MDMEKMLQLTGAMLVGLAFIFGTLAPQAGGVEFSGPGNQEPFSQLNEFHSRFVRPANAYAVWSEPQKLSFTPPEERILMKEPSTQLKGLVAVNGNRQRSLAYDGLLEGSASRGNLLDIEVSRITVIAVNMAEGGSAVATSDIVVRPTQYLGPPEAEVEEKLK